MADVANIAAAEILLHTFVILVAVIFCPTLMSGDSIAFAVETSMPT
jgi:hypothetical protein